jgi:hypothetical protein
MPVVRQMVIPYDKTLASIIPEVMTIPEIKTYATKHHEIDWKLVTIKNVHFTGKGAKYDLPVEISNAEKIFAPGTGGIGFPQQREIQDASGNWMFVATSEFSNFAQKPIPATSYIGDITCIVSWYQGDSGDAGGFQLTLRALSDLGAGFDNYLKGIGYKK